MTTNNAISNILSFDFKTLPLCEKINVKRLGRPTPNLTSTLTQEDKVGSRNFKRHFSISIYQKFNWISGCEVTNALFCFPCLLFYCDKMDKVWSRTGFKDLKHLNERAKKHENSARHMNCCMELALLGSVNIAAQLDSAYRQNIIQFNEQVSKNRYILKRIINCIKFCGKLELALRGHDEKEDSQNRGVFRELIDFSSEMDTILKEHLNSATIFKGTSKTIQNELLGSMLEVCRHEIKEQIKVSDFLAIQCDETTDISNQCQMVLIVRYIYKESIYERFWTFVKIADRSAKGLAECIENELDKLVGNLHLKLIAQTYDGAYVMSGATGGVQTILREKYKCAHFVHCYAHQLNLIMQKATSQHAKVKIFFSNLSAIPSFFSSSSNRCTVLDDIVNQKLPRVVPTRWNYNIRTVNAVFENREKLIECFQELEEKCSKTITCKEAYGLRRTLEDPDFVYWLNLFHQIFPHIDTLFNQFQARSKDSVSLLKDMEEFGRIISKVRNSIGEMEESCENPIKRRKTDPENKNSVLAKQVCDTIVFLLKERLSYRGHLEAASLLNADNFQSYVQKFPTNTLQSVIAYYPMLQSDKLKTELEVIYLRSDFKNIVGAMNMLSWLTKNNLCETFSETVKLIKIIVTTPMSTAESERCFSTLKRIKTFLRNTMNEDRLNALAMMSINKNLIYNIDNFDEKVVEHFISQKDRRIHFVYKS